MASSTSGPATRCAQGVQAASSTSSTSLPSSSHTRGVGSSVAVATRIDSAALLPAPGSPPNSTLRSGSDTLTVSPSSSSPTGIDSHNDNDAASRSGHGTDAIPANGSRRTSVTVPVAASSASRATRTSRARKQTASSSARCSTDSSDEPRDARARTSSPAGIADTRPARTRGSSQSVHARHHARRTRAARNPPSNQPRSPGTANPNPTRTVTSTTAATSPTTPASSTNPTTTRPPSASSSRQRHSIPSIPATSSGHVGSSVL